MCFLAMSPVETNASCCWMVPNKKNMVDGVRDPTKVHVTLFGYPKAHVNGFVMWE